MLISGLYRSDNDLQVIKSNLKTDASRKIRYFQNIGMKVLLVLIQVSFYIIIVLPPNSNVLK